MKVAWIYPRRDRCGIALYSERYLEALDKQVETRSFDPADFLFQLNDLIVQRQRYP